MPKLHTYSLQLELTMGTLNKQSMLSSAERPVSQLYILDICIFVSSLVDV